MLHWPGVEAHGPTAFLVWVPIGVSTHLNWACICVADGIVGACRT